MENKVPSWKGWLSGLPEALGILGLLIYVTLVTLAVPITDEAIDDFLYPEQNDYLKGLAFAVAFFLWSLALIVLIGVVIAFRKYKRFLSGLLLFHVLLFLLGLVYELGKLQ